MDLVAVNAPLEALSPELEALHAEAVEHARNSKAHGTLSIYQRDWAAFVEWTISHRLQALPAAPSTVAAYITYLARQKKAVATLNVVVSAISQIHQAADLPSPTHSAEFRAVWKGVRRKLGTAQAQKRAATPTMVRAMLQGLAAGPLGTRDKALILVAFASGMRRSELVGLDKEDVRVVPEGLEITIRRSKTDQEGKGRTVPVVRGLSPNTCPCCALLAWFEVANVQSGPVFRAVNRHGQIAFTRMDGGSVARIVKKAVSYLRNEDGTPYDLAEWGGHSMRAGFVTSAYEAGADDHSIAVSTAHSLNMLQRYKRQANLFKGSAGARLGL